MFVMGPDKTADPYLTTVTIDGTTLQMEIGATGAAVTIVRPLSRNCGLLAWRGYYCVSQDLQWTRTRGGWEGSGKGKVWGAGCGGLGVCDGCSHLHLPRYEAAGIKLKHEKGLVMVGGGGPSILGRGLVE